LVGVAAGISLARPHMKEAAIELTQHS